MHAVIIDDLEDYLSGHLPPSALRCFQAHLETCSECRREVLEIEEVTELVTFLKPPGTVVPSPSFAARVIENVVGAAAPSFWSIFGDFAFGRRMVFASLLTLAVLGTILVSRESSYTPTGTSPEAVMASGSESSPSVDRMLVTLASYEP
jgi:anti-sigma factor RsiW